MTGLKKACGRGADPYGGPCMLGCMVAKRWVVRMIVEFVRMMRTAVRMTPFFEKNPDGNV
jgi:hypothetical protein